MGNASSSMVEGKGDVVMNLTSGKKLTLMDVLFVPEIRKNLVSTSLLSKKGFKLVFESDKLVLTKGGAFIGKGYMSEGLFKINVFNDNVIASTINKSFMSSAYIVESCELWHSRKDETIDVVKTYKNDVENQENKTLKMLRSDRGGEYESTTLSEFCALHVEPQTYKEAMSTPEAPYWQEAVNDEINSIMQNHTWELVNLPPGNKPIGCKWIFKRKLQTNGTIDKYKAHLVAKGYRQKEGLDFFDTYSPVTRITSIRMLIATTAIHNFEIHQMDVKITFLNGDLDEEIYMEQPKGFVVKEQEKKVCRLIKSLYGLKQAPKQWHEKFDHTMLLMVSR
ncbi:Retrovirus-related Pol polyprotein from transposon TNT 1-94 [Vitis vinifera]|uniref:Retrovirus-related Pol polyprotein from transposon TNT 1-94 n=2 Tax=Vitis vinifera TaxID=29760 RepID=A0A438BLL9_VITVI|nr:Retrovirus-related Pol polyprotein from transposon TNT 1-94 [Vitis vinifera]